MNSDQWRSILASSEPARKLLRDWEVRDHERGWENLKQMTEALGAEAMAELASPLARLLPRCPDVDMALNNLERLLITEDGRKLLPTLLEGRARTLETILQLFATSQFFSDLLVSNPDYLEMLRIPLRSSPSQAEMQEQLQAEVDSAFEDSAVLRAFRRFRQKHILRIGTNDIIRDRPLEEITRDISRVADVSVEVALQYAIKTMAKRFGFPFTNSFEPSRCVVVAFGKLGGKELNYSSDIDLMIVYDDEGQTQGQRVSHLSNAEFYSRVVTEILRLLTTHTRQGQAYRVDLRLRPEGNRGPLARDLASTLQYYDTLGRTWERQALIKIRPIAGDSKLGEDFLKAIEPFVYRKYLSFGEINEIKALKRRIEHKSGNHGESDTEVKTGHGGIRDVEFTIQFLQLLNGGDLPDIHQANTLKAIHALERVGCLTNQEYRILDDTYKFLRKVEHRLQIMFDLQTHKLPEREEELRKLALRMGYVASDECPDPLQAFLKDYREKTSLNRTILNHLLHQSFATENGSQSPEADLVLDPNPDPEKIQEVLGKYPFRDVQAAYQSLNLLATETIPFLSTRRCRQFLANIAPRLLKALAETPDPDMALVNLEKVSATLGGKAVLWELFSFNQPSMDLYVELCAWSQFLSEILINNPGMIDELLDSLVLDQLKTHEDYRRELAELVKNASDPDPILHAFQDTELLNIGVRDILGKDDLRQTTSALSSLAETILSQIAQLQAAPLVRRLGMPCLSNGPRSGQECRFVILGLGKLGSQEMSYHSDLDLIVIYEADGRTMPPPGSSRWDTFELTDNFHFFSELARQIIRQASAIGPRGRLYQVDMRLRPTGKSGSLVIPLHEFRRYYDEGDAQLWERQALSRARVVFGESEFAQEVTNVINHEVYDLAWKPGLADEIKNMRSRIEASSTKRDLKKGRGGIVDIEFLVQMFRLKYGKEHPAIRHPNTWQSLQALRDHQLISEDEYLTLHNGLDFLRQVENRLRIFHNRSVDEMPSNKDELEKLAITVGTVAENGTSAGQRFVDEFTRRTKEIRQLFEDVFRRERGGNGS